MSLQALLHLILPLLGFVHLPQRKPGSPVVLQTAIEVLSMLPFNLAANSCIGSLSQCIKRDTERIICQVENREMQSDLPTFEEKVVKNAEKILMMYLLLAAAGIIPWDFILAPWDFLFHAGWMSVNIF